MPARWILFKAICIFQMLASSVLGITAIVHSIQRSSSLYLIVLLLYILIFLETLLAINILNNNYPDAPVAGKQKTYFNRLFLLNFLFLAFLFGLVFAEIRVIKDLSRLVGKPITALPFQVYLIFLADCVVLLFQFIILYGLYVLRRELYDNFMKKQFDFEKDQRL